MALNNNENNKKIKGYWKIILKNNGLDLQQMPKSKQNKKFCKIAILQNSNALQFVKKQTPELCTLAIERNYLAIRFVHDKPGLISKETCISVLKKDGLMLAFVKESWGFLNDEIYEIAIKQNRLAFGLIRTKDRTLKIQQLVFDISDSDDDISPDNENISPDNDDISPLIVNALLLDAGIKFKYLQLMFDQAKMVYLRLDKNQLEMIKSSEV